MTITGKIIWAPVFMTFGLCAQAAVIKTINFTEAEGYINWHLAGQDGWSGGTWSVETADGGSATVALDGFRNLSRAGEEGARLNLAVGESVTMRTIVELSGAPKTPAANESLMSFGIGISGQTGSYVDLRIHSNGTIGVAGDDASTYVGMDIANASGRLAIDVTWTLGVGAWDSSTTFQLTNLDNDNATIVGSRAWGDTTAPGLYSLVTGTGNVGVWRRAWWSEANTGVAAITMLSTDVVSVIP
jgi:hypothetical protein